MASATLNSTLMDTLVSRNVSGIDSHSVVPHSAPGEEFTYSSSLSPSSVDQQTSFIPVSSFHSSYSQYNSEVEGKDTSLSGGEGSTEDEETSTGEDLAFYFKRPADDNLSSSSKKRRKQVKPVRVSSVENSGTQADPSLEELSPNKMQNSLRDSDQFKCPHCLFEASSEDTLRSHIIEEHIQRMLADENICSSYNNPLNKVKDEEHNDDNFNNQEREEGEMTPLNLSIPRWDIRLNSQVRENGERSPDSRLSIPTSLYMPNFGDSKFGLPGIMPLGPPPFLLPFLQHQQPGTDRERMQLAQQSLRPMSNGQTHIFNLEAYCDLCNKEFCNKYFLKTHKANKHGIYSPDIYSSPSIPNSNAFSSSVSNSTYTSQNISTSAVSTPLSVSGLQKPRINSVPLPGSPFAGAFITANMSALPIRPLISSHFPSIPKHDMSYSKSDILGTTSKNGIINIEAYCEICQKEFCNKYFLKRHKSKIHNIDIEVTIKQTSKPLHCQKPGYDRPDGWCDACRKDIGSRTRLNTHKLNAHGPHIIMPMSSPHEAGERINLEISRVKPENQPSFDMGNENFSPWDNKREEPNQTNMENMNERLKIQPVMIQQRNIPVSENINQAANRFDPSENQDIQNNAVNNQGNKNDTGKQFERSWDEAPNEIENENLISKSSFKDNKSQDQISIKEENQNSPEEQNDHKTPNSIQDIKEDNHYQQNNACRQNERERPPTNEMNDFRSKQNMEEFRQNSSREINESPRTPGSGSTNDENSRELGQLCRLNQSAIVPPAVGTKYTPEQLRQLGVINPDAFCELCCKEFCNKYFLRTHRIKKHGIYTPEYSDRSKSFKEQSSASHTFERKPVDMRIGLHEYENECKCEICQRIFPNLYLMQMHKYYMHGPGQEILQQEHASQLQQQSIYNERLRRLSYSINQHKSEQDFNKNKNISMLSDKNDIIYPAKQLFQNDEQLKMEPNTALQTVSVSADCRSSENISRLSSDHKNTEENLSFTEKNDESLKFQAELRSSPLSSRVDECKFNLQEPDTSQGLRKLQSMILELTKQDNGTSRCRICQKDAGNEYILRAHLMTEHGILPQSDLTITDHHTPKDSRDGTPVSSPSSASGMDNQGFCIICKKDFFSRYLLQQHHLSVHGMFTPASNPASFLERIKAEIENRDDGRPLLASRSFCEICNKELCNKYFMKTHMLKMHGINIENGTSGGVTCDICKKELCSKYFLRVHKQNTHGLVEEPFDNDMALDDAEIQVCPLCTKKFKNIRWLQTHLNTDHDEIGKEKWKEIESTLPNFDFKDSKYPLCNICGHQFPDVVALQIHTIRTHGLKIGNQEFERGSMEEKEATQSNLQCSLCHINFPTISLLCAHEKTHTTSTPQITPPPADLHEFNCPICSHSLPNFDKYHQHILQHQIEGFFKPLFNDEGSPHKSPKSFEMTPETNDRVSESPNVTMQTPPTPKKRWICYGCGRKFKSRNHCILHVQTRHVARARLLNLSRSPCKRKLFRCRKCGGVAKSLSTLKMHIRRKHAKVPGIPTSHAQPSITDGQFVMQPFLLNKEGSEGSPATYDEDQPFVPSLVYLPVARKIQRPITVSFCLTPA